MKFFTISTDSNIEVHASQRVARSAPGDTHGFATAAGLAAILKQRPGSAVMIWNSLTGVKPVKKFKDAETAARRIFAELQKLEAPAEQTIPTPVTEIFHAEAAAIGTAGPKAKTKGAKTAAKAAKATEVVNRAAVKAPRGSSKTARLIEMLKRPGGATLEEVMTRFGWQAHTTRALMSAGGSLTRTHGITVVSRKSDDTRTYRISGA
jgi:hypothetical protein